MEVFPAGEALLDVSLSSFDCMVLYKKFLFNLFIGVSAEAFESFNLKTLVKEVFGTLTVIFFCF
tara:strand:+ start:688 stop:879 length:192 start_codon:yes stop_codon:yes gene_type:complete